MKLFDYFSMGGSLFMSLITIWAIGMLVFAVQKIVHYYVQTKYTEKGLILILIFGSLAIVSGFLAQAIGLISAFDAIEEAGDISPALVAGGMKASMIAPIYGIIIFFISLVLWGILRETYIRKTDD